MGLMVNNVTINKYIDYLFSVLLKEYQYFMFFLVNILDFIIQNIMSHFIILSLLTISTIVISFVSNIS